MKSCETSGKTVQEAIKKALEKLGAEREQVEIEILEEPSKGILGFIGQKDAKVLVKLKVDPREIGAEFLKETCGKMGIDAEIEASEFNNGYIKYNIITENPGLLIGRRGETLDSLQYITNLVVNKNVNERCKIIVDTEDYRKKREKTLTRLATRLSDKVKKNKRKIVLEPMTPHERRIIHLALQAEPEIKTYSEGEEPYRKVVIAPKTYDKK